MRSDKATGRLVSIGADIQQDKPELLLWVDRGLKSGKLDCVALNAAEQLDLIAQAARHLKTHKT